MDQLTLSRLRDQLGMQIENLDELALCEKDATSATSTSALANLQRRLFIEQAGPIEVESDETVEVFSAPGEGRECVEIARRPLPGSPWNPVRPYGRAAPFTGGVPRLSRGGL
jgi:ATP-dependent helicase/nuclease subunit B